MQLTCPNCGHTWSRHSAHPELRGLDPKVADILREEARHEAEARQAEVADKASAASDPAASPERRSRLSWIDGGQPELLAAVAGNVDAKEPSHSLLLGAAGAASTLLSPADRRDAEDKAETERRKRRGFRLGFLPIVLLAAAGIAAYSYAPRIAEAVPESEPYMIRYAEWVNSLRPQINNGVDNLIGKMEGFIAQYQ